MRVTHIRLFRHHGEPTGFWPGMPRLGSRWKVGGQVYVLVDMQVSADRIRVEYAARGGWEANRLIDPHAGCWRKPRPLWRRNR